MSQQIEVLNTTTGMDASDAIISILPENNNTNFTNGSSSITAFSSSSSSSKYQVFSLEFNRNVIILSALALVFVIFLIGTSIWYWCHRVRRRHSSPLAHDDNFIETRNIQEKQLSSSPIIHLLHKAPPIPPRPTAYTSVLGKVEYRSNL